MSAHIVLATLGSFGDLHPHMALGLGLQSRGHRVTVASSPYFAEKVNGAGLEFAPLRPDLKPDPEMIARTMDPIKGGENVIKGLMMPGLRDTYEDLLAVCDGADLLLNSDICYPAPLVAEQLGIPRIHVVLAPLTFFSAHDPGVLPPALFTRHLRGFGPWPFRLFHALGRQVTKPWVAEVHRLRQTLGIPKAGHPIFDHQFDAARVLALFSPHFAAPQPDWPPRTEATGFLYYDRREHDQALDSELAAFLDAGEPPIVATLGSVAVLAAGEFFHQTIAALAGRGHRVVLLHGLYDDALPDTLPDGFFACQYAPYSELLPRAKLVITHGGIGSMAQCLKAGKPMLVVPSCHDQPDNAVRAERLGVAKWIHQPKYAAARARTAIEALLADPAYTRQAEALGAKLRAEDGLGKAVAVVEGVLAGR